MLIVPSIRKDSFDRFIKEWGHSAPFDSSLYIPFVLMEDNPSNTFDVPDIPIHHLSWRDITDDLGDSSWIIPRRSDTVRSYAYFWAYRMLCQTGCGQMIMTLDDDCYPIEPGQSLLDLYQQHISMISQRTRWFNTLNSGKPRGIPFKNMGEQRSIVLNHGLWENVLDYDAPTQLANPFVEHFSHDNRIVPSGQYFPLCGMNVCWSYDITVLMYHLLMGCVDVGFMPPRHARTVANKCVKVGDFGSTELYRLPFDRFGDIWCGILMKRVCDHLGLLVSTGTPYIHHDRASDPFTNLIKEANGLKVNEVFWERVDRMTLTGDNPIDCYDELGKQMGGAFSDQEHAWYFDMLGDAMIEWTGLFRRDINEG